MSIQIVIAALLVISIVIPAFSAEMVTFKGQDQEVVTGRLTKPDGNGSFPAVILLHGSHGFDKHYDVWAERLGSWGYVSLQMDSIGPAEKSSLSSLPSKRAEDFCAAKSYLFGLPFVDIKRIGVMAWSQRGASSLVAFCARNLALKQENPFRVAVAFYPYCYKSLFRLDSPVLVLIGELDDWCPAALCKERIPSGKTPHETILKVYPGAYHCFDGEGANGDYMGHRLQYNPAASADSIVQVKAFLTKHMK